MKTVAQREVCRVNLVIPGKQTGMRFLEQVPWRQVSKAAPFGSLEMRCLDGDPRDAPCVARHPHKHRHHFWKGKCRCL